MRDAYSNVGTRRWLVFGDGTRLILDDGSSWLVEITYWNTAREWPKLATLDIASDHVPDSRYLLTADDGRFVRATYMGFESFDSFDTGETATLDRCLHVSRFLG